MEGVFVFNMFNVFPICTCFSCKKAFTQSNSLCVSCQSVKAVKAARVCPKIELPFQAFFEGLVSEMRWRLRKPLPKRDLRTTIKPWTVEMFAALHTRFSKLPLSHRLDHITPPGPRTRKSPFHWSFQLKTGPEDLGYMLADVFLPDNPTPQQRMSSYGSGRLYDNGVWMYACVPVTFTCFAKDRMGYRETRLVIKLDTICLTSGGQWALPPPGDDFPNRVALCKHASFLLLKLNKARQAWNVEMPALAVPPIPTPMLQAAAAALIQAEEEE